MPADSAIKAIQNKYLTLDPAAFPGGVRPPGPFLDEAPQSFQTPGVTSEPPYVILVDGGESPTTDGSSEPWATGLVKTALEGTFTLKVYYKDLGQADACMKAILFNGQAPELKQGLAFCTLDVNPPLVSMPYNCIPGRSFRKYAGFAINNERVHMVVQEFERRLYFNPN